MITDKIEYNCKKAWVVHYHKEVLHAKELNKTTSDYDTYILSAQDAIFEIQKELDEYEKNNMKVKWWFKSLMLWWRGVR